MGWYFWKSGSQYATYAWLYISSASGDAKSSHTKGLVVLSLESLRSSIRHGLEGRRVKKTP